MIPLSIESRIGASRNGGIRGAGRLHGQGRKLIVFDCKSTYMVCLLSSELGLFLCHGE